MIQNKLLMFLLSMIMPAGFVKAQSHLAQHINWSIAAELPPAHPGEAKLGQAGVFAGRSGNVLLIAGGSYFPGKKPWEGGQKNYVANIFVLQKDSNGRFSWLDRQWSLKAAKAYGASTSTDYGVVCAGGENHQTNSSRDAFLLRWEPRSQQVVCEDLPLLPIPLTNACMTAIGSKVFLIGGETDGKPSAHAFSLDLKGKARKWKTLPDMPIAMSHSVAICQSNGSYDCVYIIGGRSSTPSGVSKLHGDIFCYDPKIKAWHSRARINDGGQDINLSASAGVPIGQDRILMIGGDRGDTFHKIELYNQKIAQSTNDVLKEELQTRKLELVTNHAGFNRTLLVYNTRTNSWENSGDLPFASQVTTASVLWDNMIFVIVGEIKPGVRTPVILKGDISYHDK